MSLGKRNTSRAGLAGAKRQPKTSPSLQELDVDLWINDDAPKFNLRQK